MPLLQGNGFFIRCILFLYDILYLTSSHCLFVTTDHIGPKCACRIYHNTLRV